jgi:hypothetical protein
LLVAVLALLPLPTWQVARADPAAPARDPALGEGMLSGRLLRQEAIEEARQRNLAARQRLARLAREMEQQSLSGQLHQQTLEKMAVQLRLQQLSTAPRARLGEALDLEQVSIAGPLERGVLPLTPGARGAYAYVQPYQQPNVWAYRNYCAAGATIVLLSHWYPDLPQTVDIDQIGREIGMHPDWGAWIRNIVDPVNQRVNAHLGEELNWYRHGRAQSLEEFRWMVNVDLKQNAVPFITGIMTGGLPGWGSRNYRHVVAVYGYTQAPDGTEYISYAETSPPLTGYRGYILQVQELNDFWRAVSRNSGQMW